MEYNKIKEVLYNQRKPEVNELICRFTKDGVTDKEYDRFRKAFFDVESEMCKSFKKSITGYNFYELCINIYRLYTCPNIGLDIIMSFELLMNKYIGLQKIMYTVTHDRKIISE